MALKNMNSFYKPALNGRFPGAANGLKIGVSTRKDVIARLQSAMEDDVSRHRRSLVSHVQKYVQEHLGHDLSLQAISEHVHMHPVHLSKVYKNDTCENIYEYVLRLRMEKAVALLHNRELKVYEIAEQVGYNNPAYFIRVFKSHFNVTPQEYRNE